MKPSQFQINSDYLPLAQATKSEFVWDSPAGASHNHVYNASTTFSLPVQSNVMYRFMIGDGEYSATRFGVGAYLAFLGDDGSVRIQVSTPSGSTLKVELEVDTPLAESAPISSRHITIKAIPFKVPNLF